MASFFITTDTTVSQSLGAGQTGFVAEGATLYTNTSNAVLISGAATLTALGSIVGDAGGSAVALTSLATAARITVGQNGALIATTTAAITGSLTDQLLLNNAGLVSGGTGAISFSSPVTAGVIVDHHISNSGTIQATSTSVSSNTIAITTPTDGGVTIGNAGLILNGGVGGGIRITGGFLDLSNSGRIEVHPDRNAVTTDAADDTLVNSGTILGGILLFSGNDLIRNTGVLQGNVSLGDGNDILRNHGTIIGNVAMTAVEVATGSITDLVVNTGLIDGTVSLGGGDDTFTNRGGRVLGAIDGGVGNDTYNLDRSDLVVVDAGGFNDVVNASCDYIMVSGIEILNLLGAASLRGIGNTDGNRIVGGAGDDTIRGGEGSDTLFGNDGDNRIFGGSGSEFIFLDGDNDFARGGLDGDVIVIRKGGGVAEGGEGQDQINFSLALGATVDVNIATGVASGFGLGTWAITGFEDVVGTAGNDTITGNAGVNSLNGGEGADIVRGGGGNDAIFGAEGSDTLTGGGGADVFRYFAATESAPATADSITDFNLTGDLIDLSSIDADGPGVVDAFTFVGAGPFNGAGPQVRFTADVGLGTTLIEIRLAGSAVNDMEIVLTGVLTLTADDFLL